MKNVSRSLFLIILLKDLTFYYEWILYGNKQFSRNLCSISQIFILKNIFIEHYSEAAWKAIFNYSFPYILKSILTLRRSCWYGYHMKTKVWRFGGKSGVIVFHFDIKRFLLTGLCEFSSIRVMRIVKKMF